jgi:hypothetical protein
MIRIALVASLVMSAAQAQSPLTLDTLYDEHPERVRRLFDELDLTRPDLANVRTAIARKEYPAACRALLDHYQARFRNQSVTPTLSDAIQPAADDILQDRFTFYDLPDTIPRRPDGGLDWNYRGPTDDREWAWGLNRFSHFSILLSAYEATGNVKYVRALDGHFQDWVLANPYPGEKSKTGPWRGLEIALRQSHWRRVFTRLQNVDVFTPATRILLLSILPDHAHYLKNFHAQHGNWVGMEMNGLTTIAETYPEFAHAGEWINYAVATMTESFVDQVYPDGPQTELTSHYHSNAYNNFKGFYERARKLGIELPDLWPTLLERMANYTAYSMRPNGHGALNNDSDYDYNRDRILKAAAEYGREDWRYIATNGVEGDEPESPSVFFPWAGQAIVRNGWGPDALWIFFDVGPLGTGHRHDDKLHLSLSAFGRDLLVDSGRYSYVGNEWRPFFKGSFAHNVVLVNGREQRRQPDRVDAPLEGQHAFSTEMDYVRGTVDGFEEVLGPDSHTRIVVRTSDHSIFVVDTVEADRPREISTLWHVHPDSSVVLEDGHAVTQNDRGNLRIQPIGGIDWNVKIVSGQKDPHIQGWYSKTYNTKVPNPTVVYTTTITETTTFVWHLAVSETKPLSVNLHVEVDEETVTVQGPEGIVTIPLLHPPQ